MTWHDQHLFEAEPLEFMRLRLLADVDACHEQPEHDRHGDFHDAPGCWEGAQAGEPVPLPPGLPVQGAASPGPVVALDLTSAPAAGCAPSQPPTPERQAA